MLLTGLLTPATALAQPDAIMRVEVHSMAELQCLHAMGLDVLTERARPG